MATYIGKRIVPVHCGKWDISKAYEMLSIVLEETSGDSYIARRSVPSGTAITDTYYWMLHSLYSQQIKDMSDQLTVTEQRIKADNDATEAVIRQDNQVTREHVDSSLQATTEELRETVTQAQTAMTQQKASFDATAQQLNTRMDAVLSSGTGTGETEILDARVDANGNTYASLGESIRRVDGFLSRVSKIPFIFKERSESDAIVGTGSSIVCTRLENRGVFSGMDVALTMNNQESHPAHWVRSYLHIPDQEFQEKCDGKRICVQIWSSTECNIYWAYGYWPAFNELYTVCEWQRLHPGYNEFIIDTGSDEYKSKEKYPGYYFYVNYLFGSYSGRPLMEDGEYNFRISMFVDEDLGYGLPSSTGAMEAVFSAHSLLARHSEETDYAIGILVKEQSADIALGVDKGGAGDQGMMYGYATNETAELLPIPFVVATRFLEILKNHPSKMFRADAKAQVSFDYDTGKIKTFLCSVQHSPDVEPADFRHIIEGIMVLAACENGLNTDFEKLVNPTGRFVIGGSYADCGVTGRKLACDTYGGVGHIGGGAMSGKDPSKVDRSGAYAARKIAVDIVRAG